MNHTDKSAVPAAAVVPIPIADKLPSELLECQSWVCWRAEWNWSDEAGAWKLAKIPCHPENGFNTSFDKHHTDYQTAMHRVAGLRERMGSHFGIGIAFSGVGGKFFCLDLDGDAANGTLTERVKWLTENHPTWAERSVSGNGLHAFYLGCADGKEVFGWRKRPLEIFGSTGFVAITGDCVDQVPPQMRDGTVLLERICRERDPEPVKEKKQGKPYVPPANGGERPGDDFDLRGSWQEVLEPEGWTLEEGEWECGKVTRPGKNGGVSATIGVCRGKQHNEPLLHIFSTKAEPFAHRETVGKFNAFVKLKYPGDAGGHSKAASELKAKGYGSQGPKLLMNGIHREKHFDQQQQKASAGQKQTDAGGPDQNPPSPALPVPISVRELIRQHPQMRPVVIDGLLRQGETMNVISASKIGKSWLTLYLVMCVALGRDWLGHACNRGRVLLIDNELHKETLASRLKTVAEAYGFDLDELAERIDVVPLRGNLRNLLAMQPFFASIEPGKYSIIVLDAFYRFVPAEWDENSNANVTALYNMIDSIADSTGAAFVQIHHATKGSQSDKSVTDVGAGAGAQSRAADSHLILRPHQEKCVFVAEAATRSFPPMDPICLRWEWPRWSLDELADPSLLAGKSRPADPAERERKKAEAKAAREQDALHKHEIDCEAALAKLKSLPGGKAIKTDWKEALHWNGARLDRVIETLLARGEIKTTKITRSSGRGGAGKTKVNGFVVVKKKASKSPDTPDKTA